MLRILYLILTLGMLFCAGCTEKSAHDKKLEEELRHFKEKPIVFPDNMIAKVCDGEILPDTTLLSRPSKMVTYIGKDGCTDCKLRSLLPLYMFMLESRKYKNFGMVIILNTSDQKATERLLTELRFRHTVFYDVDGSFERLNPHIPAKNDFHTFLLNENNRVVLIGNPTHNEDLNNLYQAEIKKGDKG